MKNDALGRRWLRDLAPSWTLPLLLVALFAGDAPAQKIVTGGPTSPDGKTVVACDLPVSQRTKNVGGTDGSGLCVFSSIGHAARFQNERRLVDFQANMRKERGGGWPEKVDQMIAKYGKGAAYLQYEGTDLEVLKVALRSGRMPCVTYDGRDQVHYSGRIAHMVNIVALESLACVLDNNYVGDNELVWLTPDQFKARWTGGRKGWAVFLLAPPPPPIPTLAPMHVEEFVVNQNGGLDSPPWHWVQSGACDVLYKDSELVGKLDQLTFDYTPWHAASKTWGQPCDPPVKAFHRMVNVAFVDDPPGCCCQGVCPIACDCGCELTQIGRVLIGAQRQSSCPGGVCPAPSPFQKLTATPIPAADTKAEWWYLEGHDPAERLLYQSTMPGALLGKFNLDSGEYFRWLPYTKVFASDASAPPIAPPVVVFAQKKEKPFVGPLLETLEPPSENFGMDWTPGSGSEKCLINGKEVGRAAFMEALVAGVNLPDDAKLLRLTAILPKEQLAKVDAVLAANPDLKAKFVTQLYEPGHWHVGKDLGFPDQGILIQSPTRSDGRGQVLHYQPTFEGDADLTTALRRAADPNFDANKAPDLRKVAPKTPDTAGSGTGWIFLIVLGGALIFIFSQKKDVPK